ncbi:MAG: HAMP domain-containing histidine kinase [Candidatus Cloacimonetes bacterium]|nr:HAMP domain-containing histidine kinase [Candidatus Cloacimonadota bacterium]
MCEPINHENEIIYYFHDLRNKMSQAKSCMYVAMDDHESLRENEWLNLCTEAIDLGTEILNDGLNSFTSSHISNAIHHEHVRIELQDFISAWIKEPYKLSQAKADIKFVLTSNLLDVPKFVELHPQKLYRLRDNIVDNAIEAEASKITINIDMKDDYFVITCIDNGNGMSQDQIDQILLNKYKKDNLHGIGTQYLLNTVKTHRSVVTIDSHLGEGTTLRFLCPYVD